MGSRSKSRLWRRLLLAGAAGVVLVVAGLAALRLPAVQLRILRWAAAEGDGWKLNVARVSVGLGGGEVRGLDFSMPGIVASTEPGVALRVRPGRFLFGGRELHVERAEADGVKIVVTPAEFETEAGAEAEPFSGVLAELSSPLPWVLGAARIGAEIEVREADAELATARLRVEGGGVSATAVGEFEYELEATSRLLPPGPDAVVRSRGTVRVRQNTTNGVAAVELRGDLRLPAYGSVRLPAAEYTLTVTETAGGEHYEGALRFGAEGAGVNVTASFAGDFDRVKRVVTGTVNAGADARAVAWAGVAAEDFPETRVRGAGTFSVGVDDGAVAGRFAAGTETGREYFTVATDDAISARVELRGLPLGWMAERVKVSGMGIGEARVSGAWMIKHAGIGKIILNTQRPLEIGPVTWEDGLTPALPAARVRADVTAELTPERVSWELRSLRVGTAEAGGPEARVAARGEWSLGESGGGVLEAASLELRAVEADVEPVVKVASAGAIRVDAAGAPQWEAGSEVATLAVRALPLAWVSRWLPDMTVEGVWSEGESTVRVADDAGGFALGTQKTWRFDGLRVADAAGAVLFAGEASLRPGVRRGGDGRLAGELEALSVKDASGRALAGKVSGWWMEADETYAAEVALRAELPEGDVAPKAFGPLTVELRAKAGSLATRVGQVEQFSLVVGNADGELAALRGEGEERGWLYAQRPNGEVVINSLAMWRLTTAAIPLARLKEFFPEGLEAEGEIEPTEFLVMAEMGVWRVRPTKPLAVRGLTARRGGVEVARAVDVAFYPGFDLRTPHALRPAFQLFWEASVHATDGRVETPGGRALEFEAAFGMMGDMERALPKTVDLVVRGDLGAARAGFPEATAGLPAAGKFTARVDGDMLGSAPVEAWARLEAVPAAEGGRLLEPLELSASGKVNGVERTAKFDVTLRMGDGEAAGDLAFGVKLALEDATLRLDSALRGKRWDVTESLAWAETFGGSGESEELVAADETKQTERATGMTPLGSAFWGPLRGRFELDIGELLMTPYRVDRLRGRVVIEERELVVDKLGGEMFSGRLGGAFSMNYEPGAAEGDHALSGKLRIEQFDTARVIQTVFENDYGSLDAKVDLGARVLGRGFRLPDLLERAEVDFSVKGKGVARLTHPDARTASTLLVMGGVLTLSPELRALGRLLRKFAEMPLDELSIKGGRTADGTVRLSRVRMDSPQVRLEGEGEVAAVDGVPLPARDLLLTLGLSARDETGVILGRMRLLEKKADADGFRRLNQLVAVRGQAGRPDAGELYDLFARGVAGSRGTWGLIMRKVQREVEKQQALAAKTAEKEAAK